MLTLDIKGNLGKFGWETIPKEIADLILDEVTDFAYETAFLEIPRLTGAAQFAIEHGTNKETGIGFVSLSGQEIPYNMAIEFGSRRRFAHPFMRPAAAAARKKAKSLYRTIINKVIKLAKVKS